ncbi:autophagy-related protein 27 [Rhypophila decipiens]|uniref:Autophagy-related protein 27 n=1 Tax=Rhypophila decipiens TaxID=261697 RepID=A0AAN6Y992_9PEZI|nr:autophagy-related protein 27 [Rhypophila decipiens]
MPRIWSAFEATTLISLLLVTAPATVSAAGELLQCKKVVIDGHKFDLGELGGPHTVVTEEFSPPEHINTTYTLDICAPLKRSEKVPRGHECPNGARVCAIKHGWETDEKKDDKILSVIPIAGNLIDHGGEEFTYDLKRLSTSDSKDDSEKEGLRLTLHGGVYQKREQRAVIEFLCDHNRTGLEGEWESRDKYEKGKAEKREEKKDDDKKDEDKDGDDGFPERQLKKENAALIWDGYKRSPDDKVDTLFLTWHTKYACEKDVDGGNGPSESTHWGVFTWMFMLVFLFTAAYLIFGSWLNYNRYGARGWDLLPHGDTIRDIPYLLKDWIRRVLNTVQSSGSRGGYSAV